MEAYALSGTSSKCQLGSPQLWTAMKKICTDLNLIFSPVAFGALLDDGTLSLTGEQGSVAPTQTPHPQKSHSAPS